MRVTRTKNLKREAQNVARVMELAGIKKVCVVGARGFWTVIGKGTVHALAKFASAEAVLESGKS